MLKKIAACLLVLFLLLAGGFYYMWTNLDHFIKVAVEKYGSAATQATVHLGGVDLSLTSGTGSLSDFSIGNPKGFSSAKAISFGEISVSLDTGSIRGSGPVVIRKIVINKPQIAYELGNDGGSNLQALARNAQTYTAALNREPANMPQSAGQGRKIIIEDLVVSDGRIGVSQAMLSKISGRSLSASLPTIHLTNIGKSSGGATAAQAAGQVLSAITAKASEVASSQLAGQLATSLQGNLNGIAGTAAGSAVKQLQGLFGQ